MTGLRCTECAAEHEANQLQTVCRECSMPLVATYDLQAVSRAVTRDDLRHRDSTLWRFREMLPLDTDLDPVTLGEGGTPLLELPTLGRNLGLHRLLGKNEALNPTASFKDRGMTAAVSMARALGASSLAAPSAGNAGGALAAYGARAGLPVHIAMPVDVPSANQLEAQMCGANVTLIDGTIADCGRWIGERAKSEGWFDVSTLKEPYRVEGKKTMGYELAEQLGWTLPDVILYPTGGGTGLVGMAKAFEEMRELGWLDRSARLPRMVAVQATGCAPVVDGFLAGSDRGVVPEAPHTCASGLRVPGPIGDRWMLRTIRETGGTAIAIDDDTLLEATRQLARDEGIFAAPEAGALVAACRQLLKSGELRADEQVVLFLTGSGLKYSECFEA